MHSSEVSQTLTKLVLGIDAFYRQQQTQTQEHLDQEGLVPVHWSPLEPTSITSWQEARRSLARCVQDASALTKPWIRDWLTEYGLSVLNLGRWLWEDELGYEVVVAGAVRVDPSPPSEQQILVCKDQRDQALRAAGYKSYAAFLDANRLETEEIQGVMEKLLIEGEARTRARLPMLELPAERIRAKVVTNTPYTAYCDYPGKQVWINTDVPHTQAGLKHLAAHEAYPGHYAHMGHRDTLVRSGRMLADAALVVTNTGSSVLFEGIAERGLDLLGWRTTPEDNIAWLHNRLQWLCSIEAAHALNTQRRSPAEIAQFLSTTCDAEEAWIDGKIRFVTHPLRAPFVYTYWWGGTVVGAWWRRIRAEHFDEGIHYLYDRMHSPTTLAAHWPKEAI